MPLAGCTQLHKHTGDVSQACFFMGAAGAERGAEGRRLKRIIPDRRAGGLRYELMQTNVTDNTSKLAVSEFDNIVHSIFFLTQYGHGLDSVLHIRIILIRLQVLLR